MIVCYKTAGSGSAIAENAGEVSLYSTPSGKVPAGMLLNKFVSIDQTVRHRNWHNGEQVLGEKAPLMKRGWAVTDKYTGSPTLGATAYLTSDGKTTPTVSSTGGTAATPKAGQYLGIPDEDSYVKVYVSLPIV